MIWAIESILRLHRPGAVGAMGNLLHDIEMGLSTASLTEQEYVSLMDDVERLKQIIELMNEVELNQLINEAITGLIMLSKVALGR